MRQKITDRFALRLPQEEQQLLIATHAAMQEQSGIKITYAEVLRCGLRLLAKDKGILEQLHG